MNRLLTVLFVVIGFIYTLESQALASNDKTCKPLNCGGKIKTCPYGYHKQDGCEICKCYDPCNPPGKPILCGPNKRCFVDKLSNGTFVGRCGLPKSKRNTDICEEAKVVGLCKAAFPRFYYNSTIKTCEHFIYGGCGANNNNFDTKEKCETACSQT